MIKNKFYLLIFQRHVGASQKEKEMDEQPFVTKGNKKLKKVYIIWQCSSFIKCWGSYVYQLLWENPNAP